MFFVLLNKTARFAWRCYLALRIFRVIFPLFFTCSWRIMSWGSRRRNVSTRARPADSPRPAHVHPRAPSPSLPAGHPLFRRVFLSMQLNGFLRKVICPRSARVPSPRVFLMSSFILIFFPRFLGPIPPIRGDRFEYCLQYSQPISRPERRILTRLVRVAKEYSPAVL